MNCVCVQISSLILCIWVIRGIPEYYQRKRELRSKSAPVVNNLTETPRAAKTAAFKKSKLNTHVEVDYIDEEDLENPLPSINESPKNEKEQEEEQQYPPLPPSPENDTNSYGSARSSPTLTSKDKDNDKKGNVTQLSKKNELKIVK